MDYDLKIAGGTIVDGTGAPGYPGDVGIRDGRITALGRLPGTAAETIEAEGRVVAPGFIDLHTHYDAQVLWDRMLSVSPWHGVTTVVMGNCGFGIAPARAEHRTKILETLEKVEGMSLSALEVGTGSPWPFESFPEYLDLVERRGAAVNTAVYVGHTAVRLYAMGDAATERAASASEVSRMCELVGEAIDAGALGFATSKSPTHLGYQGRPVPSRLAEPAEIEALAGVLRERNAGILQFTIGPGLYVDEIASLAKTVGRPVTWSALLSGMGKLGSHREILARHAEFQAQGLRITPQVSCRPLTFDYDFKEPFPFEGLPAFERAAAADVAEKRRIYADPEFRSAFRAAIESNDFLGMLEGCWERTRVSLSPRDPQLEGRLVAELARERGVDPVDLVLDLALDSDLESRLSFAMLNHDEDEVGEILNDPHTVLGLADSGAHANQLCDACFATHLLGHWVRERGALALEQAVWMLTQRVAEVIGLPDRGLLAQGRPADLVVFDPKTVGAGATRRVHDLPSGADRLIVDAFGIDVVIVNGTPIRRAGRDLVDPAGPLPGQLLRNGGARQLTQ